MNAANIITFLRFVLAAIGTTLLLNESVQYNDTIAAVIFAVAAFTDWLDGELARRTNTTSKLGTFMDPLADKLEVPTVASIFPHDLVPAPRQFGERFFDVRAWHEHPEGGHFAAWERPESYARDLRQAVEIAR